jgi:uncharacterized protein YkwD
MQKLTALVIATVILSSLILPKPSYASSFISMSSSGFNWESFLANFFVPTPPPTPTYPSFSSFPTSTSRSTATPSKSPSPSPKPTPSHTPSPTPKPTVKPTASPTHTPSPTPSSSDPIRDYIMTQINAYRKSLGLYAVKTDPKTCAFATTRAKEVSTNFSHDGFNQRISNHTLPYPSYHLITENIAETSNYKNVESMWQNSPGHAANMRADTPYVCVSKYGNYYAYEGWKP